jgi:hypothetical protein
LGFLHALRLLLPSFCNWCFPQSGSCQVFAEFSQFESLVCENKFHKVCFVENVTLWKNCVESLEKFHSVFENVENEITESFFHKVTFQQALQNTKKELSLEVV